MEQKTPSVKQRLRDYLLANKGVVVTSTQLAQVASPASEWARRLRELRDEEGWPISSHHDSSDLRPGEYLLTSEPPLDRPKAFQRTLSQRTRAEVLDRDGSTCRMCGLCPDDIDPQTGRPCRMHIGHIVDKSLGGTDELDNLRTLCSSCNQGAKNLTMERPSTLWLITQVRRSGLEEQRAVLKWLVEKFGIAEH
jgi:5-methylcytosine-specific restriction endonuclease McrA